MKAKDKTTGTFKEVYVKALDSLPVGAEIDFEGTDIPTGWEETTDPESYSTEEVKTNKIYFGKPVYRKVVIRNQNITNGSTVDLSSLNIDELIHIGSRHKLDDHVFMFNSFDSSSDKVTIHQNKNELEVWTGPGSTYLSTIWIEYTKTTD